MLKTGVNLGLSWDDGGPYGVWSSAQFHFFDGKNTVDNTRFALMGGGYWKLAAEEDKRLSAGVSAFYMSYDKNLGEYAVGARRLLQSSVLFLALATGKLLRPISKHLGLFCLCISVTFLE